MRPKRVYRKILLRLEEETVKKIDELVPKDRDRNEKVRTLLERALGEQQTNVVPFRDGERDEGNGTNTRANKEIDSELQRAEGESKRVL